MCIQTKKDKQDTAETSSIALLGLYWMEQNSRL